MSRSHSSDKHPWFFQRRHPSPVCIEGMQKIPPFCYARKLQHLIFFLQSYFFLRVTIKMLKIRRKMQINLKKGFHNPSPPKSRKKTSGQNQDCSCEMTRTAARFKLKITLWTVAVANSGSRKNRPENRTPLFKHKHRKKCFRIRHPEHRWRGSSRKNCGRNEPQVGNARFKGRKFIEICWISLQIRADNAIHIIRLPLALHGQQGPLLRQGVKCKARAKRTKTPIDSALQLNKDHNVCHPLHIRSLQWWNMPSCPLRLTVDLDGM